MVCLVTANPVPGLSIAVTNNAKIGRFSAEKFENVTVFDRTWGGLLENPGRTDG